MKKINYFCLIFLAITLTYSPCSAVLSIHFIDVGEGDCILIQMPNNKNILIDNGNLSTGYKVENYLRSKNILNLDYIIITHMHPDHVGGIFTILPKYRTNIIYYNGYHPRNNELFVELKNLAKDLNIPMKTLNAGNRLFFGNVTTNVLLPLKPLTGNLNENSIVIKITFCEISFLLAGDLNSNGEKRLIEADYDLESDVLKIGHHGAEDSNSEEFIEKAKPKIAVLSVGKNSRYGYPSDVVIERFILREISLFRTDLNGTIVIQTNGKTISIEKEKG